MCLILLAISPDENLQLVVAANRDEQHSRPSRQAAFWTENNRILGGQDIQAGGTWLGVTTSGRFAAVTNFAEDPPEPLPPRSRGELTRNFLEGQSSCHNYLSQVHEVSDEYQGFNLVISDGNKTCYYSNRGNQITELKPGFYGLSNQLLDCTWNKVISGRNQLRQLSSSNFQIDSLFDLLSCRGDGTIHSAKFIVGETYGTRSCTVVRMTRSGIQFEERNFDAKGMLGSVNRFNFKKTQG